MSTSSGLGFYWAATCEEDEVSDACEFWAYAVVLGEESELDSVLAIESTDDSEDAYAICSGGEDQVAAGNCV